MLPDVRVLNDSERDWLKKFAAAGKTVIVTGTDSTELGDAPHVVRFPSSPGKAYSAALEKDFDHASPDSQPEFLASLQGGKTVQIQASTEIATSISRGPDGRIQCFLANFAGLRGGSNPIQTPQNGVTVSVASKSKGKGFYLPFLGEMQPVQGVRHGDSVDFTLPTITKGAVFWYEP